jgi:hypothetical protein
MQILELHKSQKKIQIMLTQWLHSTYRVW